jgi:hypothetical protein
MGGRDGQLHELLYSTGSGWQKRCQKVTHTGGLANTLARWVVPSVFRSVMLCISRRAPVMSVAQMLALAVPEVGPLLDLKVDQAMRVGVCLYCA